MIGRTLSILAIFVVFLVSMPLLSIAQTVVIEESLKTGDTLHLVVVFELDEDRFKSLHRVSSFDNATVTNVIVHNIRKVLGDQMRLITFCESCPDAPYRDSLVFRDANRLLQKLQPRNVDKILVFGLIWRYKSKEFYGYERDTHTNFHRGTSGTSGLIGRTFLVNAVVLSVKDKKILYEKKIKVEKGSNGPPTIDNLKLFIPSFVRRALKPVKRAIKS
jgi:hypothetical protein